MPLSVIVRYMGIVMKIECVSKSLNRHSYPSIKILLSDVATDDKRHEANGKYDFELLLHERTRNVMSLVR